MSAQEFTLFWKTGDANGWMSNWSLHGFTEDDIYFATSEHWMMYQKAKLFGDMEVAEAILRVPAKNPREVKSLGRKAKGFDEDLWEKHRIDIMVQGLKAKVLQNKELQPLLFQTAGTIIAEASPLDRIWGIGLASNDPKALNPTRWTGLNLLGISWMKVRDELAKS